VATITALPVARVLDVACGTGYLTRHLRGTVVALDQSPSMLELARRQAPRAKFVQADVPPLPFEDDAFDRVIASNFYSHLDSLALRRTFLAEAFRVAPEVVVVEQAWRPGLPEDGWEARTLMDGSHFELFKRYYTAAALRDELGGAVLLETPTFIVVRAERH
jgi:ubiquinone/menaquinone biosynthesis C-methylase UbiE